MTVSRNNFLLVFLIILLFTIIVMAFLNNFKIKSTGQNVIQRQADAEFINSPSIDQGVHVQSVRPLKCAILTSFFTSKKDPQRNRFMPPTFSYMRNFYNTVIFHNLTAIIFHDQLSEEFVTRYTTSKIKFEKRNTFKNLSINDLRFIHMFYFLTLNDFDYVLFADISDTFFWHDPFAYMTSNVERSLFLSADAGTLGSNFWMVDKMKLCYGVNSRHVKTPLLNDGLWGGKRQSVLCILDCIVHQIFHMASPNKNCNMAAMNWCIQFTDCVSNHELNTTNQFANHPFRHNCDDNNFVVIHDKCKDSHQKCISIQDGKLIRKNCF